MGRAGKIAVYLAGAIVMMSGIGFLGYIAYRDVTVQMALSEAQRFTTTGRTATPIRSDPRPLERLRPHPLSSPLHNRRFDDAIAAARAAYEAGDYDRAIALNTEALEIHPSEDLVWLLLTRRGDCYLAKNEPDNALADYDKAARLGGLDSRNYITHALALRQKGQREEATKDFEAAIAIRPDDPLIYSSRAALFAEDGDLDKAQADYAKAVDLNPRNVSSRVSSAEIYVRQNENQKAITQATIALKIDSNSSHAYVTRAKAYAQLRMSTQALADLDAATKLNTRDKAAALNDVAWCRATCPQRTLRDGKKAVTEASEACKLDRWKHWSYLDTLAAACAEAGDFDHAIKYEQQALQMKPATAENIKVENQRLQLYQDHKPYREEMKR
jgi:tetratricopeptide (TPR) repeat protein